MLHLGGFIRNHMPNLGSITQNCMPHLDETIDIGLAECEAIIFTNLSAHWAICRQVQTEPLTRMHLDTAMCCPVIMSPLENKKFVIRPTYKSLPARLFETSIYIQNLVPDPVPSRGRHIKLCLNCTELQLEKNLYNDVPRLWRGGKHFCIHIYMEGYN